MKKLMLGLVAFAVAFAVLSTALAAPVPAPQKGTLTIDGKAVKQVQVHEGVNTVTTPDGTKLRVVVKNGKVTSVQRVGTPAKKTIGAKFCFCLFGCSCHD